MSDWGAVHSTISSALAGLDQESGQQLDTENFFEAQLAQALSDGAIPQARLDDMVGRILTSIFATGLYDDPPRPKSIDTASSDRAALEKLLLEMLAKDPHARPSAAQARRLPELAR